MHQRDEVVRIVLESSRKSLTGLIDRAAMPGTIVEEKLAQVVPSFHVLRIRTEYGAGTLLALAGIATEERLENSESIAVTLRQAIAEMNGAMLDGRALRVNEAEERGRGGGGGRGPRRGGGGGGGRW